MLRLKKSLLALFICGSALMMTGCASSIKLQNTNKLPANLSQPCPDLPELHGKTGKSIFRWSVTVVNLYNECQAKHRATVSAVNDLSK